jgi:hypothetical protein
VLFSPKVPQSTFAGDFEVGESPSGIVLGESTASVQFPVDKGDEQGSNLLANLILAAAEEGIYWFEIYRTGISWH